MGSFRQKFNPQASRRLRVSDLGLRSPHQKVRTLQIESSVTPLLPTVSQFAIRKTPPDVRSSRYRNGREATRRQFVWLLTTGQARKVRCKPGWRLCSSSSQRLSAEWRTHPSGTRFSQTWMRADGQANNLC